MVGRQEFIEIMKSLEHLIVQMELFMNELFILEVIINHGTQ